MIKKIAPFPIKGFLYYQGEEDDLRAADYYEMMCYLIDEWRGIWNEDALPFLFVQLPMYASREEVEAGLISKNWCIIRENQYRASKMIANAGIAVIIDKGEYDNIRPLDKQTVGYRLALQALKKVYKKNVEADSPVFSWAEKDGAALKIHFENAQSGLVLHENARITAAPPDLKLPPPFEIAGVDGVYYPAKARIDRHCVVLFSPNVPEPETARYAWSKLCTTPLFAKNGLPAMPFRTYKDKEC